MAHFLDCKVDETREAGMSNMRAFPAVVFGKKAMRCFKCGSFKLLLLHARARRPPVGRSTNSNGQSRLPGALPKIDRRPWSETRA